MLPLLVGILLLLKSCEDCLVSKQDRQHLSSPIVPVRRAAADSPWHARTVVISTMVTYNLTEEVYLTILLHAAKYPSCTICGLLLGSTPSGGSKSSYKVSLAVPLFHLSLMFAPCVEAALTQVGAFM